MHLHICVEFQSGPKQRGLRGTSVCQGNRGPCTKSPRMSCCASVNTRLFRRYRGSEGIPALDLEYLCPPNPRGLLW